MTGGSPSSAGPDHTEGRDPDGPSITTLGSWKATDVTAGQVERALSGLRRHEQRAAVRASVVTLVAVVTDQREADAALGIVHDLRTRHPSRTIVLVVGPHRVRGPEGGRLSGRRDTVSGRIPSGRDAVVEVHAVNSGGRTFTFEDVVLTIRGQGRHHLNSVVEPFALPDVPMVAWLPSRLPSVGDPLLAAANMVVVDSRAVSAGEEAAESSDEDSLRSAGAVLSTSAVLAKRIPVADLSWVRLAPWRRLLAGLFEGVVTRPFVAGVERVVVTGNPGPRLLLGGWLLERLGLAPAQIRLEPAAHVTLQVEARDGSRYGRFCVERPGEERILNATVDIDGGLSLAQMVTMRRHWPALALAAALTQLGHDPGYEEALSGARTLLAARDEARCAS